MPAVCLTGHPSSPPRRAGDECPLHSRPPCLLHPDPLLGRWRRDPGVVGGDGDGAGGHSPGEPRRLPGSSRGSLCPGLGGAALPAGRVRERGGPGRCSPAGAGAGAELRQVSVPRQPWQRAPRRCPSPGRGPTMWSCACPP